MERRRARCFAAEEKKRDDREASQCDWPCVAPEPSLPRAPQRGSRPSRPSLSASFCLLLEMLPLPYETSLLLLLFIHGFSPSLGSRLE
eukprot:scaffold130770_cov32-Tisochrysis_lutea.AAC.6